jgi:hypothetical protein
MLVSVKIQDGGFIFHNLNGCIRAINFNKEINKTSIVYIDIYNIKSVFVYDLSSRPLDLPFQDRIYQHLQFLSI